MAYARNPRDDRWCGLGRFTRLAGDVALTDECCGARNLVRIIRASRIPEAEHRALGIVSLHRDRDGKLFDVGIAAVELLNL